MSEDNNDGNHGYDVAHVKETLRRLVNTGRIHTIHASPYSTYIFADDEALEELNDLHIASTNIGDWSHFKIHNYRNHDFSEFPNEIDFDALKAMLGNSSDWKEIFKDAADVPLTDGTLAEVKKNLLAQPDVAAHVRTLAENGQLKIIPQKGHNDLKVYATKYAQQLLEAMGVDVAAPLSKEDKSLSGYQLNNHDRMVDVSEANPRSLYHLLGGEEGLNKALEGALRLEKREERGLRMGY